MSIQQTRQLAELEQRVAALEKLVEQLSKPKPAKAPKASG